MTRRFCTYAVTAYFTNTWLAQKLALCSISTIQLWYNNNVQLLDQSIYMYFWCQVNGNAQFKVSLDLHSVCLSLPLHCITTTSLRLAPQMPCITLVNYIALTHTLYATEYFAQVCIYNKRLGPGFLSFTNSSEGVPALLPPTKLLQRQVPPLHHPLLPTPTCMQYMYHGAQQYCIFMNDSGQFLANFHVLRTYDVPPRLNTTMKRQKNAIA